MKRIEPDEPSTCLLLTRIAELLIQIQAIDQEQAEFRELLGAYLRTPQQEQGEVSEWKN